MQAKDQTHGRFVSVPLSMRLYEGIDCSDPTACWIWTKKDRVKGGYGRIRGNDGRNQLAHRVSFEMAYGPVPDGLSVCHQCDRPPCINPGHLFAASHQDNIKDMMKKGRKNAAKGKAHGMAKLSEQQVQEIRHSTLSSRELGRRFGVGHSHVLRIKNNQSWVSA